MQVQKPELMTVVPKAFSLDEYLDYQANGPDETSEVVEQEMKYFIIGGSFLVPGNAEKFQEMLEEQGYNTQILFNPETRFNYVAYEAFADYKQAVDRTLEIRDTFNENAWIFELQSE
ncbi:SPOR domain-containing protein [Gracilimonas sp.]|uniref:SPOR domain-containing protein n=1 Tax=Gracilimonas sp. TaxID=1974203 RepID=UPI0028718724|nr:hypothetical protein [Gracilimonas sp.]